MTIKIDYTRSTEVTLLANNYNPTKGNALIQDLSKKQRISKALIRGTCGLIISIALIAIPLLHFFLVPLGLLITGGMVSSALSQISIIKGGEVICPYCSKNFNLVARNEKYPFQERCPHCFRESEVKKILTG